jgi:hypothetical protein
VHQAHHVVAGQQLQVPADGHLGHGQAAGQLVDRGHAQILGPQGLHDLLDALLFPLLLPIHIRETGTSRYQQLSIDK